ncbi:MAG: hypothetical protein M0Z49_03195 [Chloroflexi bacterium]|nr:hypothetical protein [Chloroflexota bacterium]
MTDIEIANGRLHIVIEGFVHDPARAIKIDLDHEHYRALVIEVADPAATVHAINDAVRGLPAT